MVFIGVFLLPQNLPLTKLKQAVNEKIKVKLKDNTAIEGSLLSIDQFMNLVLADAVELDREGNEKVRWGSTLIRGNNILWVELLSS